MPLLRQKQCRNDPGHCLPCGNEWHTGCWPETTAAAGFQKAWEAAREQVLKVRSTRVPKGNDAQNLAKRFRQHGEAYFRFITLPGIENKEHGHRPPIERGEGRSGGAMEQTVRGRKHT